MYETEDTMTEQKQPDADGYYDEQDLGTEELDLSFLDDESTK